MRSVFGLLVALSALFLIWLWATGRFEAAWNGIKGGSSVAANPANSVNLQPFVSKSQEQLLNQILNVQSTPDYLQSLHIPVYVPTVGNLTFDKP